MQSPEISRYWVLRRPFMAIGALAVGMAALAAFAAFVIAWSGLYSVAASRGHWALMERFLRFGMVNSVRTHAPQTKPPSLDDNGMIQLGAAHYHEGCAPCHGAPGMRADPVAQAMLPAPPDLRDHVPLWTDQELFWIIKNGLKYTGMPAWPTQDRDDEVWTVVAFVRKLPKVEPHEYAALALGAEASAPRIDSAAPDSVRTAILTCARCHGANGQGPASELVPILHGQPADWLANVLNDYATGARHSGIMQPLAAKLNTDLAGKLADFYSSLNAPGAGARREEEGRIEAGRQIAHDGVKDAGVPGCVNCHSADRSTRFPRLEGQSERYIALQLDAWRNGKEGSSGTHDVMAPLARRLTAQQVRDVAAYFASRGPGGEAR